MKVPQRPRLHWRACIVFVPSARTQPNQLKPSLPFLVKHWHPLPKPACWHGFRKRFSFACFVALPLHRPDAPHKEFLAQLPPSARASCDSFCLRLRLVLHHTLCIGLLQNLIDNHWQLRVLLLEVLPHWSPCVRVLFCTPPCSGQLLNFLSDHAQTKKQFRVHSAKKPSSDSRTQTNLG